MNGNNTITERELDGNLNGKNRLYPNYGKRVARVLRTVRRLEDKRAKEQKRNNKRKLSNSIYEMYKGNIKYWFNRYGNSNECAQKLLKENKKLLIKKIGLFEQLNQETFEKIMESFPLGLAYGNGEWNSVIKTLLKNLKSFNDLDYEIISEILKTCKYEYGTLELLFKNRKHFNGIENLTDEEIKLRFNSVSNYTKNKYKNREEFKKVLLKQI